MPAYRIYWLDDDNHVLCADYLVANTDADARNSAKAQLGAAAAIEVWRNVHLITRIEKSRGVAGREPLRIGPVTSQAAALVFHVAPLSHGLAGGFCDPLEIAWKHLRRTAT